MGDCFSIISSVNNFKALNDECPICLDDLYCYVNILNNTVKILTSDVKILNCNVHGLHRKCYYELIKRHNKCPLCEQSILEQMSFYKIIMEKSSMFKCDHYL